MNCDKLSPPSSKQPQLAASTCEISELADVNLAAIFKHLSLCDRLLIEAVCKRWHAICRVAWLDITELDLGPIPGEKIIAMVTRCPNLRHVIAVRKTFAPNELHILSRVSLSSLKLYECTTIVAMATERIADAFSAIFSDRLQNASWDELVLHDLEVKLQSVVDNNQKPESVEFPASFPASLKRLQLSGIICEEACGDALQGLGRLQQVEALILHSTLTDCVIYRPSPDFLASLVSLKCLRELYLSHRYGASLLRGLMQLPKLETLFLCCSGAYPFAHFVPLVTKHVTLRVIAFTGTFAFGNTIQFPARTLEDGNSANSEPMPILHIFVDRCASERVRFPNFSSDAAKVYAISDPLPQFLEREDIKPIFEERGWIAAKIRELAKHDAVLYDYAKYITSSIRSIEP